MTSETDGPADVPDTSNTPDSRRRLISGLALAPAGANVIMQLSRLPIGRAVAESKIERMLGGQTGCTSARDLGQIRGISVDLYRGGQNVGRE